MSEKNDYSSDECSEDGIEPKLKYVRLDNDLRKILNNTSATCIAVHTKFICIGSQWGVIYVFDHQGHNIVSKKLRAHSVSINDISIDENGEFIASCSDDGRVFVQGLFTKENNYHLSVGRLVKTITLDPFFCRSPANKRFITGDDKLTLYERTLFGGVKPTVLCESEGLVRSLSWGGNFLAWSSNIGVRVYDMYARCSLGLIKWEETSGLMIEQFRCNLRWADSRTLLIGWVDTVRVCVIRRRSNMELAVRALPQYLVDPVSTFQTEFFISGIAPLDQQLVLLGVPKELDTNNKSLRPQLYVVEYKDNDYTDICTDSLTLNGFKEYTVNDYHLEVLSEENMFFIVAPKQVVIASPYDLDDRIEWLINHKKYEEALQILMHNKEVPIHRYNLQSVGIEYMDDLLDRGLFDDASKLGLKIFGKEASLWEEQIYKFAKVTQLRSVSLYIPRTMDSKLNPHIYEMILYEYMMLDAQGFLQMIKEWPHGLYNVSAVINAVLDHIIHDDENKNLFIEALAILYSYVKKYDKSLSMYLTLKHSDVFNLIQNHNLHDAIQDKLTELMELDHKKTISLLLNKNNNIPSDVVVNKLWNNQLHLYRFLDEYHKKYKDKYHKELVELYAVFDRQKLLQLLMNSDQYPITEALEICEKNNYYPEMVFLLGRIGNAKEALDLIINKLKDIQRAISWCHEYDDAFLWDYLIDHCIDKSEFVTFLLQSIGSYIDPTALIVKIKNDMEIPGLKNSLVKMLNQYNLQVSVQEGCKKIVVSDYFNLQKKKLKLHQRGTPVSKDLVCGACGYKLIQNDVSRYSGLKIFNCRHVFHNGCLEDHIEICVVCYPLEKKRNKYDL